MGLNPFGEKGLASLTRSEKGKLHGGRRRCAAFPAFCKLDVRWGFAMPEEKPGDDIATAS
jgi:hypothetical protein